MAPSRCPDRKLRQQGTGKMKHDPQKPLRPKPELPQTLIWPDLALRSGLVPWYQATSCGTRLPIVPYQDQVRRGFGVTNLVLDAIFGTCPTP